VVSLFCWAELTWTLLSFTATVEQIAAGAAVSLTAALACAPLGPVAGPWCLLRPRRWRPLLAATGSVNDYALYLAGGLVAVCAAPRSWP
jgi:hypothetical protein